MNRPTPLFHRIGDEHRDSRWPRRAVALLASTAALVLSFGAAAQKINDVPMAVKNNVPPNFMFMVDNSGSMTNIVPTAPYNENVDYTPTSNCSGSERLAAGTDVYIRITAVGNPSTRRPFIRVGNTYYRHSTHSTPQMSGGQGGSSQYRCFARNSVYDAHLLASENSNTTPPNFLPSAYTGNYLNWYFGTTCSGSTAWSGSTKPLVGAGCTGTVKSRMEIARDSAKTAVDQLPKPTTATAEAAVRVGLSTYYSGNSGDGGTLLVPIKNLSFNNGDNTVTHVGTTQLKTAIDGLEPEGNTPLAETLTDIGRYLATGSQGVIRRPDNSTVNVEDFLEQNSRNSCLRWGSSRNSCANGSAASTDAARRPPITEWCQSSYVFMLTDGRSNQDLALSNNTYLRDYDRDCSGALASTCTGSYDRKNNRSYESAGSDYLDDVAKALFDIDLRPDIADPRPAAVQPRKRNNARTYVIGFADTQVQNDPLLIAAASQGGGKFFAAADDVALRNALLGVVTDAFAKDAASAAVSVANPQIINSDISYASSYFSGAWYGDVEAYRLDLATGAQIRPAIWSARDLLNARSHDTTLTNGRKIVTYNGTVGTPFAAGSFTAPASLTANVINYLRGDRSQERADGTGLRVRSHLLGDIINAESVVMNYPGINPGDSDIPIVFQPANDGMLHVFDGRITGPSAGQELWAYVPRAVHGKLAALTSSPYEHQYYVDGTPAVAEVTGQGAMTRLLVGGLGKGGGAYFGLDISGFAAATESAAASKVKWEFTNTNLGYSFGTPLIVNTTAGWRVVISSGYGNGTGGPNGNGDGRGRVWVLDPATGNVLATHNTNVGSASSPAGLAHLSKPANITANAMVRYVYGGDLLGNVWRFDIVDPTVAPVKVAELKAPNGTAQPITAPVEVGPVSASTSKHFLYVGTGRYLSDDDVPGTAEANAFATQRQSVYGLIDDTAVSSPIVLANYRHSGAPTCPTDGGDGVLTCQQLNYTSATGAYRASTATRSTSSRGWYLDLPTDTRLSNGRVTGKPAITVDGTLAFTVNIPTSTKCDPGGSSWFMSLSGESGGAVPREPGGTDFFDGAVFLGNALASRVVVIQIQGRRKVGLIQMSDRAVINKDLGGGGGDDDTNCATNPSAEGCECTGPSCGGGGGTPPDWRRIYWRQLK